MTHFPIFKETLDHLDDEHPILYTTAEKYLSLSLKKKKRMNNTTKGIGPQIKLH